jgi:hypothetical protein
MSNAESVSADQALAQFEFLEKEIQAQLIPLSSQEQDAVKRHLNVEIYVGRHGIPFNSGFGGIDRTIGYAPTQEEYSNALGAIAHFNEESVILAEDIGYSSWQYEATRVMSGKRTSRAGILAGEAERTRLERSRGQYAVDSQSYAVRHAVARGATLVPADLDVAEMNVALTVTGAHSIEHFLAGQTSEEDEQFAKRVDHLRGVKAGVVLRRTVLTALETAETDNQGVAERKRTIGVVYGAHHFEDLTDATNRLGIEAVFFSMVRTANQTARAMEHVGYLLSRPEVGVENSLAAYARSSPEAARLVATAALLVHTQLSPDSSAKLQSWIIPPHSV